MTSAHPADSAIYGHLWTTPEASALFSDEGRTQAWLDILAALAQAQADVGLIPPEAAAAIRGSADVSLLDLDVVAEQTRATGHSTMGLIRALRDVLPPAGAGVGVLRRHRAGPVRHLVRAGLPGPGRHRRTRRDPDAGPRAGTRR